MLSAVAESYRQIKIEKNFYRLIPSRFPPVSLYTRLVREDQTEALTLIENLTNPRLKSLQHLAPGTESGAEASPRLQNWNLAPFAYPNPEGSRFFPKHVSCLELSDSVQTALAVSVRRREHFLSSTNEPPTGLDMRLLMTPLSGTFVDLTHVDTNLSQKERREIGKRVFEQEAEGVIFRPAERTSATCIGVLKGSCLGKTVQSQHYRFVWDGQRISRLYAFDKSQEIAADLLKSPEDVFAGQS